MGQHPRSKYLSYRGLWSQRRNKAIKRFFREIISGILLIWRYKYPSTGKSKISNQIQKKKVKIRYIVLKSPKIKDRADDVA
jgi:hypothetical protein